MMGYRYRLFGGFRLFLAFLVVLQHFVSNAAPLGPLYDQVVPYEVGSLAVLVFFCLSGFVITEAATRIYSNKPFAYLFNRFLRIVPHFVVALIIAIIVYGYFDYYDMLRLSDRAHPNLTSTHAFTLSNIVGNVFGFMPGCKQLVSFEFVDIIWAIRIEMIFYFVMFGILLIPKRERLALLLPYMIILLGLATLFISKQFGYGFYFLFGALLYDHRRHRVCLLFCVIGMTLYFVLFSFHVAAYNVQIALTQYLALVAMIGVMTWLAFKLSARNAVDQSCGELSYPLYIHHQNITVLMLSITTGYSYSAFVIGVVLSVAVSYGLMRLVDPAVNRLRDAVRGETLQPVVVLPSSVVLAKIVS